MPSTDQDTASSDLVAFWRRLDLSGAPYVHPDDRPFFARHRPRDLAHAPLDALNYEHDAEAKVSIGIELGPRIGAQRDPLV
jgi:hypothetical protein